MEGRLTFRIEKEEATAFKALCKAKGTNYSKELRRYVSDCLKAKEV